MRYIYNILKHPDGKTIAIKQEWNWAMFFLGGWWMLYHKMWVEFLADSIFFGTALVITFTFSAPASLILWIVVRTYYAVNARVWQQSHYEKNGYKYVEQVVGQSAGDARANYLIRLQETER